MKNLPFIAAVMLSSVLGAAPALAQDIVVPGVTATRSGGSNQTFPFNLNNGVSQRYQQIYAAAQFGSAPVTLNAIKFRQASDPSGGNPFASTISSITLNLSTALTRQGAASSVFAANVGRDNVTVFNGALTLQSTAPAKRDGSVQPFDIIIPFATPFTYDPTVGDLLLDVFNFSGGLTTQFDFVTGGSNAVSRVVGGQGQVNAPNAFFVQQGAGLVTAFQVAPLVSAVPEPASWAMMILGFGVVGAAVRRRTTRVVFG
ncbi:PEPxxWA-CTERM sorting domain-containing protein [uncultured Sphingomonas sp.]|uniref:PEPxxWA-CTERM sorting domain-containing protein n=1 Tax=uncultured Sphingomonas sp. TaxID=158754 RepID=UPI0035CAC72C